MIENSNFLRFIPFPANLISESSIETNNNKISKSKRENSGNTHPHQQDLMSPTPIKINQDNGIIK